MNPKDKIVFVGDIHGEFATLGYDILHGYKYRDAYVIQVGDFGIGFNQPNYYRDELNRLNLKLLEANCHLFAIRGNHDNPSYFQTKNNPFDNSNITLLPDYTELTLLNKKLLCVGGAVSIDRAPRIKHNEEQASKGKSYRCWWPDEGVKIRSAEEFNYDVYDIVVTHTRPSLCGDIKGADILHEFEQNDPKLRADLKHENAEMDRLWKFTKPARWFYGHWHQHMFSSYGGTKFLCLGIDEHYMLQD